MDTIAYIRTTGIYNDSRATKEIIDLANSGRQIIVLSWDRDGKANDECKKVFSQAHNVSFHFYSVYAQSGIGFHNIHKLVGWFKWVYRQLKNIKGIGAVHACDLDAGWPAYMFCKRHGIPLVYDIYDYYIDSHSIPQRIVSFIENLEIKTINYSSVTIICTEERREQIKQASPHKVIVIHNSPDIEIENGLNIEYDCVYCGGLDNKRLIGGIINNYIDNQDLSFCMAGYGENTEAAIKLAETYSGFVFKGAIPYNEVIDIERHARCLTAIYDPAYRNHRLCAPNKFYEAIALGKPVIVCKGTGIDRIVEDNNIGVVINYDVADFYTALRSLVASPELCEIMGKNGRNLYDKEYRWEYMRKRLLDAYAEILH